jgi:predicted  nucleic acid-binding Zn-ribbon protein
MNNETHRYFELLDQRIALLETLAKSLVEARQDVVGLDVNGLEARIVQQERLCEQVSALDGQLSGFAQQCMSTLPSEDANQLQGKMENAGARTRLAEIRAKMQAIQNRVKELNATHQLLLRRCRRTAGALLNMYAKFEVTYAKPPEQRIAADGRA